MNVHQERYLNGMKLTIRILQNIFSRETPERLTTLRDGADGWTALEVLCHLRDFDVVFYERAKSMIEQDNPTFTGRDHEAMARDNAYNAQNPQTVLSELVASRGRFADFFAGLSDEQWERTGTHPERGAFTPTHSVAQVFTHDTLHIEQITRILAQA